MLILNLNLALNRNLNPDRSPRFPAVLDSNRRSGFRQKAAFINLQNYKPVFRSTPRPFWGSTPAFARLERRVAVGGGADGNPIPNFALSPNHWSLNFDGLPQWMFHPAPPSSVRSAMFIVTRPDNSQAPKERHIQPLRKRQSPASRSQIIDVFSAA